MKTLLKLIEAHWPILVLLVIGVVLFWTNYKNGTYFLGWDNLFPEMNLAVNIKRSLFAVWEEYRGLGLLDGMSFAANLPHYLFLWFMSLILPLNTLRYVFFFLMHSLGGLGMYKLVSSDHEKLVGFFAAAFYLLNLATIQMFYAPYEPFAVHFAFLPWLVLFIRRFVSEGRRRDLFYFGLVSVLAIPQAHVPTIFLVYFLAVGVFLVGANLRRAVVILATIFAVNAYWLLPYGYFVVNHTQTVVEAKINEMSREKINLKQKSRGNLADVLTLKGFLLDAKEPGYVMPEWRDHLDSPLVSAISALFLTGVVLGAMVIILGRRRDGYPFIVLSLAAIFFLGSDIPVLAAVNTWLRSNFSLFGEAFRFSFTKFSILLAFSYSVLLTYGLVFLFRATNKKLVGSLFLVMVLVYSWPAFRGSFFYDALRVNVPEEYFETAVFFGAESQKKRVALSPQPSYWSWRSYNFGYRGSGFLWYGVPQPTMDLAFTPWSRQNENYYWEVSYALYSKNLPLLERVLEKYQVSWLLLDGNVINRSSPKALFLDELEEMVGQSEKISLTKEFKKIKIYSVALATPMKDFVYVVNNLPEVGPTYKWNNLDQAYFDLGDYTTGSDYTYPFRSLFTGRQQKDLEFDQTKISSGQPVEIAPEPGETEFNLPNLPHDQGYLITAEAKNISGKPFLFWIENLNSRRADLETYMSSGVNYFIQPPMERDGLGYTLHFDNEEIGGQRGINELEKITVAPIDFWGLVRGQVLGSGGRKTSYVTNFLVEHPNPAFYRADLGNLSKDSTIVLSQSYDEGWLGLAVDGKEQIRRLDHLLVNNWANGWSLSGDERIVYLFYWPQLLEFLGLGLLAVFLIALLTRVGATAIITDSKRFTSV